MRARRSQAAADFAAGARRLFIFFLILGAISWVGYQYWLYWQTRHLLPMGTTIGQVDVSGLTAEEAQQRLEAQFRKPVLAKYHDEVIELNPADAGFVMDTSGMLTEVTDKQNEYPHWERFAGYLLQRPLNPIEVRLRASHDPAAVRTLMGLIGELLDQPASAPQLLTDSGEIQAGKPGYVVDVENSAQRVEEALYDPNDRVVELIVEDRMPPELDLSFLETHLRNQLETFNGIGSLYILDLQTGEEIRINADVAVSGLSIVKIPIMLEMFRAVDNSQLDFDTQKLFEETAIFSGNFSANLLLDVVAGENNAYLGVDKLTASMRHLGLENTFIATPYEEPPRAGKSTYQTPANSRPDINLDPDPAMQTTAAEMGALLGMIYDCANGGGTLIAAYPQQLTPSECQTLINTMALNDEGNLIRYGVPEEVTVAHKHGWAYNTHGDAGIVFSPGGDYVIVQYLYQDSDWLNAAESFPLLRELSRSVYNYYNVSTPYVDHKRAQKAAGKAAAELIAQQIEAGTLEAHDATDNTQP